MSNNVMRNACIVVVAILVIAGVSVSGAAQQKCPEGQFLARYFKNETLSGAAALVRCEKVINNGWGDDGPTVSVPRTSAVADSTGDADESSSGKADGASTVRSLGTDHFSVQWNGLFRFSGGDYTFLATADDGIRVWVDGQLIINEWRTQGVTEFRATRNLTPGTHRVIVEYFENVGGAVARVNWHK